MEWSFDSPEFFLNLFNRRQVAAERFGERLHEFRLPLGDADWFADVAECVLGFHAVARFAKDEAYRRRIRRMFHQAVDCRQVIIHLPGIGGRELLHLQVDDDKTSQLQMVKEQVEVIVLVSCRTDCATFGSANFPTACGRIVESDFGPGWAEFSVICE